MLAHGLPRRVYELRKVKVVRQPVGAQSLRPVPGIFSVLIPIVRVPLLIRRHAWEGIFVLVTHVRVRLRVHQEHTLLGGVMQAVDIYIADRGEDVVDVGDNLDEPIAEFLCRVYS